jgi:hypothetical protein
MQLARRRIDTGCIFSQWKELTITLACIHFSHTITKLNKHAEKEIQKDFRWDSLKFFMKGGS